VSGFDLKEVLSEPQACRLNPDNQGFKLIPPLKDVELHVHGSWLYEL
jgi:hypothetical protein